MYDELRAINTVLTTLLLNAGQVHNGTISRENFKERVKIVHVGRIRGKPEGSAMARLGVRDFEIHWISRGFRISDLISGFHVDFWISKWISGFQSGFLDFTWVSGFQSGFLDFTWISGFQSGFLHSGFCLKSYYLLF